MSRDTLQACSFCGKSHFGPATPTNCDKFPRTPSNRSSGPMVDKVLGSTPPPPDHNPHEGDKWPTSDLATDATEHLNDPDEADRFIIDYIQPYEDIQDGDFPVYEAFDTLRDIPRSVDVGEVTDPEDIEKLRQSMVRVINQFTMRDSHTGERLPTMPENASLQDLRSWCDQAADIAQRDDLVLMYADDVGVAFYEAAGSPYRMDRETGINEGFEPFIDSWERYDEFPEPSSPTSGGKSGPLVAVPSGDFEDYGMSDMARRGRF